MEVTNSEIRKGLKAVRAALVVSEAGSEEGAMDGDLWFWGFDDNVMALIGPTGIEERGLLQRRLLGDGQKKLVRFQWDTLLAPFIREKMPGLHFLPIYSTRQISTTSGPLALLLWDDGVSMNDAWDAAFKCLASTIATSLERFGQEEALRERVDVLSQGLEESHKALEATNDRCEELMTELNEKERQRTQLETDLQRVQREKAARDDLLDNESSRLSAEVLSLHDQVYRQQSEINEASRRNDEAVTCLQAQSLLLEGVQQLCSCADLQSLKEAIPAVVSSILSFSGLDFYMRASMPAESSNGMFEVLSSAEVEISSSPQASRLPIMQQVTHTGLTSARRLKSFDSITGHPCSSLCIPLGGEGAQNVVGTLVLERRGEESHFSDEEMERVTKLAPFISNALQRLAREKIIIQHHRMAGLGRRALNVLSEAEKLWQPVGTHQALLTAFERSAQKLLNTGRDDACTARCTAFIVDTSSQSLRGSNGEVIPCGVGTAGIVVSSGEVHRDGGTMYAPIVSATASTNPCLGVLRIEICRDSESDITPPGDSAQKDTTSIVTQEDAVIISAFCRLLVPLLNQARTLQTAFDGMKDASLVIRSVNAKLDTAESRLSEEKASKVKLEEALLAIQMMQSMEHPDNLGSLMRMVEDTAKLVCGVEVAALVLSEGNDGSSRGGGGNNLWTLWPKQREGERVRLRIPEALCHAELHALQQSVSVSVGRGSKNQFSLQESWLVRMANEGGHLCENDSSTLSIVPLHGVGGVIEVVKAGAICRHEELALMVLAQQVSALVGWYYAKASVKHLENDVQSMSEKIGACEGALAVCQQDVVRSQSWTSTLMEVLRANTGQDAINAVREYLESVLGVDGVVITFPPSPFESSVSGMHAPENLKIEWDMSGTRATAVVLGTVGMLGNISIAPSDGALPSIMRSNMKLVEAAVADVARVLSLLLPLLHKSNVAANVETDMDRISGRLLQLVGMLAEDAGANALSHCAFEDKTIDPKDLSIPTVLPYMRLLEKISCTLFKCEAANLYLSGGDQDPVTFWRLSGEEKPGSESRWVAGTRVMDSVESRRLVLRWKELCASRMEAFPDFCLVDICSDDMGQDFSALSIPILSSVRGKYLQKSGDASNTISDLMVDDVLLTTGSAIFIWCNKRCSNKGKQQIIWSTCPIL